MSTDDRQHRLRYIYSQLKSMSDGSLEWPTEADGRDFNDRIDELIALGYGAEGFKLRDQDFFRPVASVSPRGEKTYYDRVEVRGEALRRQLRAVLTYIRLVQTDTVVEVDLQRNE